MGWGGVGGDRLWASHIHLLELKIICHQVSGQSQQSFVGTSEVGGRAQRDPGIQVTSFHTLAHLLRARFSTLHP